MARPKKENRKDDILEAGLEVFADKGYYNTTTALIAEKAGISQPYVFKFFKTKEELFVAALDRAYERILQAFEIEAGPEDLVNHMIKVYEELTESRPNEIALQVIGLSVTEDAIRSSTQKGLASIRNHTLEKFQSAGIPNAEDQVTTFLARGYSAIFPTSSICPSLWMAGAGKNRFSSVPYFE